MGKKDKNQAMVEDAKGNMVPKGSALDPEVVAELAKKRAEAAARRAAKAAAKETHTDPAAGVEPVEDDAPAKGAKARREAAAMKRSEKGPSRRQKMQMEKEAKAAAEAEAEQAVRDDPLGQFMLTLASKGGFAATGGGDEDAPDTGDNIMVSGFGVIAPGGRVLLQDSTLRLLKGHRYGLMGPNGSGKSTLLRFIAAKAPHTRLPVPNDLDILLVEQETKASEVSVIQQVLAADTKRSELLKEEQELWALVGDDEAAEEKTKDWTAEQWEKTLTRIDEVAEELTARGADAAEGKVRRILSGLGFTRAMQEAGSTLLSGGWRVRVSLARALFREPSFLLLDEPTNHLDLNAVLWLEDHLAKRFKGTALIVSHDADFLHNVCTDVLDLNNHQLEYYPKDVYKFLAGRQGRDAKRAADYNLQERTMKEQLSKGLSKKEAEKKVLQVIKKPALMEKPKEYKVTFSFKNPEDDAPTIAVMGAGFGYPNTAPLFRKMSFSVGTHSRVAVVGPNGAGKTTLLQMLTGKLLPTAGEVQPHQKLKIGRFDQHFEELLPGEMTPAAFLKHEYGLEMHEARKSLGMFGLDGPQHIIPIAELSGGQKARVVFASLSQQKPQVLILDEPTNHLDMESVEALVAGIKAFEGGVVLVSHDARLIIESECEVWVCEGAPALAASPKHTGIRIEDRGFNQYRKDVLRVVEAAALAEEKRAAEKAAEGRRLAAIRRKKLDKLRAAKN
eukprot:TRINITY_DN3982_c0_g1_i1.p1 TRINITY_DN3982_c0_g1~~TRINITY_DN3982_c0_g1_i1.p1  ORF type:complete len:729 (+),score=284.23 TRINITY_DN3982_c0_g1_i1:57-2243(+)